MMGQTSSGERVTPEWAEVQRQAFNLKELAFLTYDSFVESLNQLNQISKTFADSNGKRLIFIVKPGTDSTLLWKATIRIGCVRVDVGTEKIVSYRLLNLKQYMQVYRLVMCQVGSSPPPPSPLPCEGDGNVEVGGDGESGSDSASNDDCCQKRRAPPLATLANSPLTASMILEKVTVEVDQPQPLDECCICMERKPELILPCAHSYCVPCIEQWNVSSKTCPVCREALESTDDSWVISEAPDSLEIEAELHKLLNGLARGNS